ncbi:MAG: hypothetical protein V5A56_06785 [Halolamina sp.]
MIELGFSAVAQLSVESVFNQCRVTIANGTTVSVRPQDDAD